MPDLRNSYFPELVETDPEDGDTAVGLSPDISMFFNLRMYVDTLEAGASATINAYLNQYIMLVDTTDNSLLSVEFVSYTRSTDCLVITPTTSLDPNTLYTVILKVGFAAETGRATLEERTFSFTTGDSDIDKVVLVSPIDQITVTTPPILVWNSVPQSGALYSVQVSDNILFSSTIYATTGITETHIDALSANMLVDKTTYYWRVRAEVNYEPGTWSDTRGFYISLPITEPLVATPSSIFDEFGVTNYLVLPGDTNLSEFPTVTILFNKDVDSTTI